MPETKPYIAYGLTEALDIFTIQQLRTLFQFYTDQQGDPLKIDVKAAWSKGDVSSYPFVGVMSYIPKFEPVAISDIFEVDPGETITATINTGRIGLSLQAIELRELARLREFLLVNLDRGFHPVNQVLWRSWFMQHNVELLYADISEPEQVDFRTLQMRTRLAQGEERMERTDIETLWMQDVDWCVRAQITTPRLSAQGVINGLQFTFELEEEP